VLCIRASSPAVLSGLPAILAANNARATFFLPAGAVQSDKALVASFAAVGEIQNGGTGRAVSRLSMPSDVLHQVSEGSEQVRGATGHAPNFYLPVNGSFNPAAYLAATSAHQRGVVGDLWVRNVRGGLQGLRSGDVVVLDLNHASAAQAQAMLVRLLQRASAHGLLVEDLSSARLTGNDRA
jgi:peptidoglycan/xylan/chitin deacetylase (PgdA/CDA1 family)